MRILIVEDELPTAEDIKLLLKNLLGEKISSIHIETTLNNAFLYLSEKAIDILILDLNLHGRNGFELLKNIVSKSFHTIIISANIDKAIEAFEYGVLDFIPKPYSEDRILKAFDRLKDSHAIEGNAIKYFSVQDNNKIKVISLTEIKYFKGANVYVELHLNNGKVELYNKTLNDLLILLPSNYVRLHKSYIVDIRSVKTINNYGAGKYEIELNTGDVLPLSRKFYKIFKTLHPNFL